MRDGPAAHLTCSLAAGLAACLASNPLDVIRTRLMVQRRLPHWIALLSIRNDLFRFRIQLRLIKSSGSDPSYYMSENFKKIP